MLIGGIDEAGRGPVIGPMVMAIVVIDEKHIEELKKLGVKDSKELSDEVRRKVFNNAKKFIVYSDVEVIEPEVIDRYVIKNALNELEVEITLKLIQRCIQKVNVNVIYVDSPDPNPDRYGKKILNRLRELNINVNVVALNKADKIHPVVSLASILAKIVREDEVRKLKSMYGDFGSGYPSDPKTINFIKNYLKKHGELPRIVRKSWSTVKKILQEVKQQSLIDWF